ncbi:AMP-binding protein [Streptosporangiaceae bacterium NEAU-GS5]|nr:AMP-binding protein [Streptosporangiaceae bacterium NEAU-GS5]
MSSWSECVLGLAEVRGRRPAITEAARRGVLTYDRLGGMVTRAALGISRRGLRPGDRVVVNVSPGSYLPVAVHTVAAAGGVVVLVPVTLHGADLRARLTRSTARMMITDSKTSIADAADSRLRQIFTFGLEVGATPFIDLLGDGESGFAQNGGLAGENDMVQPGEEVLAGLRAYAERAPLSGEDVVLVSVTDPYVLCRAYDLALSVGAHVVAAPAATPVDCLLLAEEFRVTAAVVPAEVSAAFGDLRAPRLLPPF